jgi:hypothetical protein
MAASNFVLRPVCAPTDEVLQIELYGAKILPQFV